jgi:hypothetical protein
MLANLKRCTLSIHNFVILNFVIRDLLSHLSESYELQIQ